MALGKPQDPRDKLQPKRKELLGQANPRLLQANMVSKERRNKLGKMLLIVDIEGELIILLHLIILKFKKLFE